MDIVIKILQTDINILLSNILDKTILIKWLI